MHEFLLVFSLREKAAESKKMITQKYVQIDTHISPFWVICGLLIPPYFAFAFVAAGNGRNLFRDRTMKKIFAGLCALSASILLGTAAQAVNCNVAGSMTQVKNFKVGAREYVEFKIKSPATYIETIAAVTGPFEEDPSGDPVVVSGALFTKVQFHTLDWTCTIPRIFTSNPVIKDLKSIEQFEGYITYVIGRRPLSHYLGVVDVPCGGYRCVRVKFGP
jgi:hypothetical protein